MVKTRSSDRDSAKEESRKMQVGKTKRRGNSSSRGGSLASVGPNAGRPSQPVSPCLTSTCGPRVEELKAVLWSKTAGLLPEDIVYAVQDLVEKHPLLVGGTYSTLIPILEKDFPKETARDLAVLFESCKELPGAPPKLNRIMHTKGVQPNGVFMHHHRRRADSKQERGNAMKRARVDPALGCPLDQDKANKIWPKDDWDQVMANWIIGGGETIIQELVAPIKVEECTFEILFKGGSCRSVCGNLKPDVVLQLKGCCATPLNAGVLLSLKSTTGGLFDSDAAVGEASIYGEMLLKEAEPVRTSIVVGVSDLKSIRWFKMIRNSKLGTYMHNPMHPYVIEQSLVTSSVRESLCTFLIMDPCDLGIDLTHPIHQLPKDTGEVIKFLGSGATSNVYEAKKDGQVLALKVPVNGSTAVEDEAYYLQQLEDIDGVPRFVETINTIVCLEPVGKPVFDISSIKPYMDLKELVDVLFSAHKRGIVHRDIRPENIMTAHSLHRKTVKGLFLLDWGFAAPCGVAKEYCGGIMTASDEVLRQCQMDMMVVYKESDDLVSLVRCIFLLCYPQLNEVVDACKGMPEALLKFWAGRLQAQGDSWEQAEDNALRGDYESLIISLRFVHLKGFLERTGG